MGGAVADARGAGGGRGASDGGQSLGEVPVERRSDYVDGESDRHYGHQCLQHHWTTAAMVMNGHLRFYVTLGRNLRPLDLGQWFFLEEIEVKMTEDKCRVQCQRQRQR